MTYEELTQIYKDNFSLYYLGKDINTKFALISLICYLTLKVRGKKPTATHKQVIKSIVTNEVPDRVIDGLAVMCDDFAYGCTSFPTFNIEDKKIPEKIKEILINMLPF